MSDPFTRLGALGSDVPSPDLDAIKLRAHRIRRRRQTGLAGAGAAALAVIAVVGVLLVTGPGQEKTTSALADRAYATTTPRALGISIETPAAGEAKSAETSAGTTTSSGGAAVAGAPAPGTAERSSAGDSAAVMQPNSAASKPSPLEATLEVSDQTIGRGKTFTLKVCNVSSATVTRDFGTSQRYDFEVSRRGKLVWRWSDGQMFSQVIGSESWKPKGCKSWSESWDASTADGGRAPAGDYEAVGILKAQPELRTSPTSFTVSTL